MSTETLPWFTGMDVDSPWRRLHWTLPLALLICAGAFTWFAYSMNRPAIRTPEPVPVDAELVELPASAQAAQQPTRPKTVAQPRENSTRVASPAPPAAPAETAPAVNNPPAPSENRNAQPILRPLPVIPDDLRQDAMNETATARFHVAADGSATVELVKPTQNPRLNRLLLDSLKHWKFMPVIKDGKPVASTEDLVIRVQVK
jgi:periplasmic protein TonB